MRYQVYNTKTNQVVGTYSTLRRAMRAQDRKEMAYGACIYKVKPTIGDDMLNDAILRDIHRVIYQIEIQMGIDSFEDKFPELSDTIKTAYKIGNRSGLKKLHNDLAKMLDELLEQ